MKHNTLLYQLLFFVIFSHSALGEDNNSPANYIKFSKTNLFEDTDEYNKQGMKSTGERISIWKDPKN